MGGERSSFLERGRIVAGRYQWVCDIAEKKIKNITGVKHSQRSDKQVSRTSDYTKQERATRASSLERQGNTPIILI